MRIQPDSSIFIIGLQDVKVFLHITFWRYFYIIFQRWKVKKKSQNSRNQGFSYYFCLMTEGFRPRAGDGSGSGSIPLTNGSGSGSRRPKNTWIRIRIRIRNTAWRTARRTRLNVKSRRTAAIFQRLRRLCGQERRACWRTTLWELGICTFIRYTWQCP